MRKISYFFKRKGLPCRFVPRSVSLFAISQHVIAAFDEFQSVLAINMPLKYASQFALEWLGSPNHPSFKAKSNYPLHRKMLVVLFASIGIRTNFLPASSYGSKAMEARLARHPNKTFPGDYSSYMKVKEIFLGSRRLRSSCT